MRKEIDLLLHYTKILKNKNLVNTQFSSIEPKIYELNLEKKATHHGLFEFVEILKQRKKPKIIKKPQQFLKIIAKKALNDINYYEEIINCYHKKTPFEINPQKVTSSLLENKIKDGEKLPNTKLFKQDLFILNVLLNIQRKGLSNIDSKDIVSMETIIYSRKQQIKTLLVQYIPLTIVPNFSLYSEKKNELKNTQNLPQISRISETQRNFLHKRKSASSESSKKMIENTANKKPIKSHLRDYFSLFQNPKTKRTPSERKPRKTSNKLENKQPPSLFETNFSEIQKSEIKHFQEIIQIDSLSEYRENRPKALSQKKKFSEIKKIRSSQNILLSDSLNTNFDSKDLALESQINKKIPSMNDIPQTNAQKNLVFMQRQSIYDQQKRNEDERKDFNLWSNFLKKSIQLNSKKPDLIDKYDFSKDECFNEKIEKVEELLKDFVNNQTAKQIIKKRVKTLNSDSDTKEIDSKPKNKIKNNAKKHGKIINQNSLLESIFSKKLNRSKKHENDSNKFHSFTLNAEKCEENAMNSHIFEKNLNLSLNNLSLNESNHINILQKDFSQLFSDYNQKEELKESNVEKFKRKILKKAEMSEIKHAFLKAKKEILPKLIRASSTQLSPQSGYMQRIKALKKTFSKAFSKESPRRKLKKQQQIFLKKKISLKKKIGEQPLFLESDNIPQIDEPDQIELNKEEVKSLNEYLVNEGFFF